MARVERISNAAYRNAERYAIFYERKDGTRRYIPFIPHRNCVGELRDRMEKDGCADLPSALKALDQFLKEQA